VFHCEFETFVGVESCLLKLVAARCPGGGLQKSDPIPSQQGMPLSTGGAGGGHPVDMTLAVNGGLLWGPHRFR
jgi:hypothetical protein